MCPGTSRFVPALPKIILISTFWHYLSILPGEQESWKQFEGTKHLKTIAPLFGGFARSTS